MCKLTFLYKRATLPPTLQADASAGNPGSWPNKKFWKRSTSCAGGTENSGWQGVQILPGLPETRTENTLDSQLNFYFAKWAVISRVTRDAARTGRAGLREKTGWADEEKRMVGWYIGYIQKNENTYYFTNCVQTTDFDHPNFAKARIEITYSILDDLKLIKKWESLLPAGVGLNGGWCNLLLCISRDWRFYASKKTFCKLWFDN